MRYSFTFDASACTGCKSCQVACKDKNELPLGVLWRRVYEVSGGTWARKGAAWTNNVFAYNVSIGCNHCEDPICASVCPSRAYLVRDDGVVWLDTKKCIGCEYCAWACPYSAPQYSPEHGRTTKCDFCVDLLDQGLPPACVASCPMRALDYTIEYSDDFVGPTFWSGASGPGASRSGDFRSGASSSGVFRRGIPEPNAPGRDARDSGAVPQGGARRLWEVPAPEHPFPLPAESRTRPHVSVTPHPAMLTDTPRKVANIEEVRPRERAAARRLRFAATEHISLLAFTLLGQMAAGIAIVSLLLGVPVDGTLLSSIGVCTALALVASLFHLGRSSLAWRAPLHAGTSPVSREVILVAAFGGAWLLTLFAPSAGRVALAVIGVALVYSMAEVYRLDAVPGWNSWRTPASFALSALVAGVLVVITVSGLIPAKPWAATLYVFLVVGVAVQQILSRQRFYSHRHDKVM